MVLILLRMLSAVAPANVSAQSPPWRKKASPRAASAMLALRSSHSPANTSGGEVAGSAVAAASAPSAGPSGCCGAGRSRPRAGPPSRAACPRVGPFGLLGGGQAPPAVGPLEQGVLRGVGGRRRNDRGHRARVGEPTGPPPPGPGDGTPPSPLGPPALRPLLR